jgi:hypothetical protein
MKFTMGFRSLMATALLFGITEGVFRNEIQVRVYHVHCAIPMDRVESKRYRIVRSCHPLAVGSRSFLPA